MTATRKHPGAPTHHSRSARKGRQAKPIVTQPGDLRSYQQRRYEEQMARNFKCGLWLGLAIGLAIGLGLMALIMWLWAVPTVDGCVANMQQMQEQILQRSSSVIA